MLDDKSLATAVGLFLQYREGDYTHHDHPPNLAALAALGAGGGREGGTEEKRLSSVMARAQEAWKVNAGLSQTAAMTRLLTVLEAAVPGWRDGALIIHSPGLGGDESIGGEGGEGGVMEQHGRLRGTKKMTPRGLGGRGGK